MESLVPLIGRDALDRNEDLKTRIQLIIEEEFGHKLRFVDGGSIYVVHRADPLKLFIPFTVSIEGAIDPLLREDMIGPIRKSFPSAFHIEGPVEHIPRLLHAQEDELSLGHVNRAPVLMRRVVSLIFQHLSEEHYSVEEMALELGIGKSTLDRRFHEWHGVGPNTLRYRIQMCEARRLLIDTECQAKEISETVGYGSIVSFDHAFHRFWKNSPSQMRAKYRSLAQNVE
jgi:AraC-like DNA-binding protein